MPCDLTETDPFEQVYVALWTLVERNPYLNGSYVLDENGNLLLDGDGNPISTVIPPVVGVIKPGNKIKFNKEECYKLNIAHADTPELQLLLSPMSNFEGNCDFRYVTKTYTWALSTGTEIRTLHNKISFELFRSLVDCDSTLSALTWCSCRFYKNLKIITEDVGRVLRDLNREVDGWASLLVIEVDFTFPYNALKVL